MNVIRRILEKVACCHEWEGKIEHFNEKTDRKTYLLYCHKCGKMKKVIID